MICTCDKIKQCERNANGICERRIALLMREELEIQAFKKREREKESAKRVADDIVDFLTLDWF